MNPRHNDPVLLVKWRATANWLLDKVDSFPTMAAAVAGHFVDIRGNQ